LSRLITIFFNAVHIRIGTIFAEGDVYELSRKTKNLPIFPYGEVSYAIYYFEERGDVGPIVPLID
jgi:hypothetical protein